MKKVENFSKYLFDIVLYLIIIQAIFLGIKQITFHFIAEELFSRSMVTMVSMTIGTIFLVKLLYPKRMDNFYLGYGISDMLLGFIYGKAETCYFVENLFLSSKSNITASV